MSNTLPINELQNLITQRWPEALYAGRINSGNSFLVSFAELAPLFPETGIPYGQLIEITGGVSSGKTTLLQRLIAGLKPLPEGLYVDIGNGFFPPAFAAAGVDLARLLVVKPKSLVDGIRIAETLLHNETTDCIIFDLIGVRTTMPEVLLHRLRQQITKARAIAFFLTENNTRIIPASMISLQLTATRLDSRVIELVTTKSRISCEGARVRIACDRN
jgi:hypothetical protein